ncbi:MAG TPA: succinate dehydrogenase [Actinomycetota bacterium]|nr:succinate dehydrogenase [Actinomycetota bacterium]
MSDRVPGVQERGERGPVRRKGVGVPTSGWFDPRGRAIGGFAFAVNRITGLGLVFYLYLHLTVLSLLLRGEQSWNDFLKLATSWAFLSLDVLLLFGLLYHGLNGIRVALVGTGVVPNRQKALWWSLGVIGTILLIGGALHIYGSM